MHVNQSCIGTQRTWLTRSDFSSSDANCISPLKTSQPRKQVDPILLLAGDEQLRRYNTWTFENDSDRADPEIIWRKFEERLEPQVNFRMARFCLREYKLKNTENIDDFVARYKLQVKKCKFRDNQETEERLIEQIITGTRHPELQKLLLPKGIELTLQEALNSGRTHEASFNHMKQMAEIQGGDSQEINTIKRCGNTHGYQKGKCPAWLPHVRPVEKRIIGQRCTPTKMKTRDLLKQVRHTILNNRMRFRIKSATIESVRWTQTQESPASYIESLNSWCLLQFSCKETIGPKSSQSCK